jgi:predicted 3-demethylubiquinone-9 3-methyltransferase (glyoxalase superfamily)
MVQGDTQEQIDHFWSKVLAQPKAEQCGRLKDKFGLSWQIVSTVMDEMPTDRERALKVGRSDGSIPQDEEI